MFCAGYEHPDKRKQSDIQSNTQKGHLVAAKFIHTPLVPASLGISHAGAARNPSQGDGAGLSSPSWLTAANECGVDIFELDGFVYRSGQYRNGQYCA